MKLFNPPKLRIKVKVSGETVECELIKTNKKTILVKIPNGSIIERKIGRDVA